MTDITILDDNDSNKRDANLHRETRPNTIEPGHFWKCLKPVTGVDDAWESSSVKFYADRVYLLTRLEYFDGKLHSIALLDDPARGTRTGVVTVPILLDSFEQISDAEAASVRNTQMLEIQGRVAELQKEMADVQANPTLIQSYIDEKVIEWEKEKSRNNAGDKKNVKAAKANLPALTSTGQFNVAGALTQKITALDVNTFRHMAQRQGKVAEFHAKWMTEKIEDMGRVMKALTPFYAEHAALGLARAHDALEMASDVEKGLRSLKLYTGEGVEINTLVEGASAPMDEPLTVYQRKLFVNEEFAVYSDVDRMFDHTHDEVFIQALKDSAAFREQLIPAKRGVVAMAMRRNSINYSAKTIAEAMEAEARNKLNKALFLLIRDGDNWYQVWSEEPSHEIAPRLFPTRDEMDKLFKGIDGEKIGFEDLRFTKRTKEFDHRSLTYKRFLILACGLDHRLKLFGNFYPENETFSFISMRFQEQYMRFVADDDSDHMLGNGLDDVHTLISNNKEQLAAGCRVIVFGSELFEQQAAPGAFSKGRYSKGETHYDLLVKPRSKYNLLTVRRDKGDLVVDLPVIRRDTHSYSGWGTRRDFTRMEFNVRVALNKLESSNLGYLLLDLVKAEDLKPYIYSRQARIASEDYIYGFKLAVEFLKNQEEKTAPLFSYLEQKARSMGLTSEHAKTAVLSAVYTWREKNNAELEYPEVSSPAVADIEFEVAEAAYAYTKAIPLVTKFIDKLGGRAVRVMRAKRGTLIAYYEQPIEERDTRIHNWDWVGRRVFNAAGKPTKDEPTTVWLHQSRIVGEFEFHRESSEFIHSGPKNVVRSLENVRGLADAVQLIASCLPGAFKGERQGISDHAWLVLADAKQLYYRKNQGHSGTSTVLLPMMVDTESNMTIGVTTNIHDLLYFYASDSQRAALLAMEDENIASRRRSYLSSEARAPRETPVLKLNHDNYGRIETYVGPFGYSTATWSRILPSSFKGPNFIDTGLNSVAKGKVTDLEPSSSSSFKQIVKPESLWIPPEYRDEQGNIVISRFFPGLASA